MQIIKQVMDLYSNQVVRGIKSFLNKINIQTSNSNRTYYLEAGADNEYPINADPGGAFRATEFELSFKSFIPTLTRDGYGSNIKCIISTDANSSNLRTLSGNYYASNFYSNLISTHTTVNRITGINALADVGSNLTGTTVTNLTSILARGVAARTNTVVTNAHAVYAESPKHGVNRYAGFFEEPTGGSGENFSIKALGDCNFQKSISINGRKITYSATEPVNPNPYDIWYELNVETLTSNAQLKQVWFRTAEGTPANRKWLSVTLHCRDFKIKDGTLSTNQEIPISFSNRYGVAFETVFIQAFIGSGNISTDPWTIFLQNGYGVTATQVIASYSFSSSDTGAVSGSNIKKTFLNVGYTVNGSSTSSWNYINLVDPQQILWLRIFKPGTANSPALTEPTMFFEYRLVRP